MYSITEEGTKELLRWLADGNLGLNQRTPILLKVFFMGERSREENICFFEQLWEFLPYGSRSGIR